MEGERRQGSLYLAQALRFAELVVSSDQDGETTSSQNNAAINFTLRRLVNGIGALVQSRVNAAFMHVVEDNLSALRAAVIQTTRSEFVLVKK